MDCKIRLNHFVLVFGILVFLSGNYSCKKNGNPKLSSPDSVTFLYLGDERIFHQDYWGMEATYWMFLPLVSREGDARGIYKGVLAESWSHSDDYRVWTVQLRKDIYWHDGVQMSARDVKFTIDLRNEVNGGGLNVVECELIDDLSFRLIYKKPVPNLPSWEVYYPKHLLESLDPANYYGWDFWKKPVGNGPYRYVRSVPKTMMEVEANPSYFRNPPKIKKAVLKFAPNASLPELLSGNVDAITFAPRDFLFKLKGDLRFKSYYWWGSWLQSIHWNHNDELFANSTVRKALTMAVNRIEMAKVLNYPDSIPIADVLYTSKQGANFDFPKPLPYDPQGAVQLLNQCGWKDSNNDRILDKNGKDFHFTMTVQPQNIIMATYLQDNLRQIGVRMEIETMDGNIIRQRLEKNDFQAILQRLFNSDKEVFLLKRLFGKDSYVGYNNKKIDSLLTLLEGTGDPDEIEVIFKKMMPIIANDYPFTFLFPEVQTHIVSSRIKGLNNHYRTDPVWFLEFLSFD